MLGKENKMRIFNFIKKSDEETKKDIEDMLNNLKNSIEEIIKNYKSHYEFTKAENGNIIKYGFVDFDNLITEINKVIDDQKNYVK